jgi:hypothetical protein
MAGQGRAGTTAGARDQRIRWSTTVQDQVHVQPGACVRAVAEAFAQERAHAGRGR